LELLDPSAGSGTLILDELLRSSIGAEDDDDSTELEEVTELELTTELLDCFASLGVTLEEEPSTCSGSLTLEELPRSSVGAEDDDDSTELEEVTELELTTELLDCFASLAMTLEEEPSTCSGSLTLEELPRSSVGVEEDEGVKVEDETGPLYSATGFHSDEVQR